MYWSRKVLICLTLCCAALVNHAQQHYPKTLLWRITGKGLKAPSYLFGTMHLNDQRLFNFGDSVYSAIERTAGLAIEVSPDELCAYYVNQMFDELQDRKKLGDILDKDDYKRYGPALAKKFDKDVDDITSRDIVKEKNKWMQDLMEKGEMPTFVDAYLFNIARRQGKWVGGIEDISDQAGLLEDLVDKSDIMYLLADDSSITKDNHLALDKMIDIYINQDLNKIEEHYNSSSSAEEKDLVLIRRNVKMARRIDSLTALRTMFLAIGAAHLPGDSGVIELLQKRGFTVEPVFASKKIAAKDYKFKEVQLPWVQIKDEQDLYTAEMPTNPASIKLMGMMDMKFLFDIFNMSAFCTMAIVSPGDSRNLDSLMTEMLKRMYPDKNAKPPVSISNDGVPGKEYIAQQDGSYMRVQLFAHKNVIYVALMSSLKKETISSSDANKFFKSFVINKTQKVEADSYVFADSILGIKMVTPAKLTVNKQFSVSDNESFKITTFTSTDLSSGSYLMLISREVKPGYHILDDSVLYDDFYNNLGGQYTNLKKSEMNVGGQKIALFSGRNKKDKQVFGRAMTVVRDNRNFIFMVLGDSSHVTGKFTDDIYNSLEFTSPPSLNWDNYEAPDKSSTAWAPSLFRPYEEAEEHYMIAYDTATSTSYFILPDTLSEYTWYESDSALYATYINRNVEDSLLYEKQTKNGDFEGKELLFQHRSVYTRMRVIPHGNVIYKLFVIGGKELSQSENTNRFFESFRLSSGKQPPAYLESKAMKILQDLGSSDSSIREQAYAAMSLATFTKKDLSLLHDAFPKIYESPYTSDTATIINDRIAGKITEIADTSSLTFFKEQYLQPGKEKDELKTIILSSLAQMPSKQSYELITSLLSAYIPDEAPEYLFGARLAEEYKLTADIYPKLQQLLAKHKYYGPSLANLALSLIDSNVVTREKVMEAENDFIAMAALWSEEHREDESESYDGWSIIRLLASFNTPASNNALSKFLHVKDNSFREDVVYYLLKNNQKVPAWAIDSVVADPDTRVAFYEHLKQLRKTKLFPKKYLTQARFAETDIFGQLGEEAIRESVEFVGVQKATWRGKEYNFYLYKVGFDYDTGHIHLGISGGWDLKKKKLEKEADLSGFHYVEDYDADQVRQQLEAYLAPDEEEDGED